MPTTLHFTSGETVKVTETPTEVRTKLREDRQLGEPFSTLNTDDGPLYLDPAAVAYFEDAADRWAGDAVTV